MSNPEINRSESIKVALALSLTGAGAILGAFTGPDLDSRGFTTDKLAAAEYEIEESDEAVIEVVGHENACQVGVYNVFRQEESLVFPSGREEIKETLSEPCPDEPALSEDKTRLIQTHMSDLGKLLDQQAGLTDKQKITWDERLSFIVGGAVSGLIIGAIGIVVLEVYENKK